MKKRRTNVNHKIYIYIKIYIKKRCYVGILIRFLIQYTTHGTQHTTQAMEQRSRNGELMTSHTPFCVLSAHVRDQKVHKIYDMKKRVDGIKKIVQTNTIPTENLISLSI